ncbi:MAG: SOS response-associated peptidase [Rhodospirillales bacterium]|nr:SOS response-associated peptidase [Rhodospirillales bacterium]
MQHPPPRKRAASPGPRSHRRHSDCPPYRSFRQHRASCQRQIPDGPCQQGRATFWCMCTLYAVTKGIDAVRSIVRRLEGDCDFTVPQRAAILPDGVAPVVTQDANGRRSIELMRWGFPPRALVTRTTRPVVTNARWLRTEFWIPHLERRCLVPATAFCEYQDGTKTPIWFARPADRGDTRPLFFFAGLWCAWSGRRGTKDAPAYGKHRLFTLVTTFANELVAPLHSEAMPVILPDADACDQWLDGRIQEALALQRPPPADWLTIVSRGPHADAG